MRVFWLGLVFTLAGCGFHLRGLDEVTPLPFEAVYLKPTKNFDLDLELNRLFKQRGLPLADTQTEADVVLSILGESRDKVLRTVNDSGKAQEYTLSYNLSYTLSRIDGTKLTHGSIPLTRTVTTNANRVLASDSEEESLYRDMRRDALSQMLVRLSRLSAAGDSDNDDAP